MLLDEKFETLLRDVIGRQEFDLIPPRSKEVAMQFWRDQIKPFFVREDDEYAETDYFIPIPGALDNAGIRLRGGYIQLDRYVSQHRY